MDPSDPSCRVIAEAPGTSRGIYIQASKLELKRIPRMQSRYILSDQRMIEFLDRVDESISGAIECFKLGILVRNCEGLCRLACGRFKTIVFLRLSICLIGSYSQTRTVWTCCCYFGYQILRGLSTKDSDLQALLEREEVEESTC